MHKAHVRPTFFISAKSSMVILLFVLFYSHTAHTQNLSQSPYSYYGLGDMQYMGSAMFGSMGQVSHHLDATLTSSRHVQLLGHDAEANKHAIPGGKQQDCESMGWEAATV